MKRCPTCIWEEREQLRAAIEERCERTRKKLLTNVDYGTRSEVCVAKQEGVLMAYSDVLALIDGLPEVVTP